MPVIIIPKTIVDRRASGSSLSGYETTTHSTTEFQRRIIELCLMSPSPPKEAASRVQQARKILDQAGTDYDLNIISGQSKLLKHKRTAIDQYAAHEIYEVSLLTTLIDDRAASLIRLMLEYGIDVQLNTDWFVCQELIAETALYSHTFSLLIYDPIVAMLEDCSDYHPPNSEEIEVTMSTLSRSILACDFTMYASYVEDLHFIQIYLQRHGSLYHIFCWSNHNHCSEGHWLSDVYPVIEMDLISLRWRLNLLIQSLMYHEQNWLTIPSLLHGFNDRKIPHSYGSMIIQELICPYTILIAGCYMNYEICKFMLNYMNEEIIPLSDNVRLQLSASMIIQRIVDILLNRTIDAPLSFLYFLVREYHANGNCRLYYTLHEERSKVQSIYEGLIVCGDVPFYGNMEDIDEFMMNIDDLLKLEPIHEERGYNCLMNIFECGNEMEILEKFIFLVEESGADPLMIVGQSPIQRSVYHRVSHEYAKELIGYYFEKGYIPHVDDCFLDGKTPLMIACTNIGYNEKTIKLLATEYQANVNIRNKDGQTALMIAVRENNYDAAITLFHVYGKDTIDIDVRGSDGRSLREMMLQSEIYRDALREYLPHAWKKHKMRMK